jgi:DNA modification methylase
LGTGVLDKLALNVASYTIDRESVPQHKLDLENRVRTSVFPWRGQFSPGLIDLMLSLHSESGSVIVDPFVGSGTTLFESSRRGLECYGGEINPAAVQLARIATLAAMSLSQRRRLLNRVEKIINNELGEFLPTSFFRQEVQNSTQEKFAESFVRCLANFERDSDEYTLLAAILLLAMGDGADLIGADFQKAFSRISETVESLTESATACKVFLADARKLPLPTNSADLVITSPPYINVFNYHQNFRKAVELLGWDVLGFAKSEIGANRKHRGNRFFTVVQYCIDMLAVLGEMKRYLKSSGRAVITIGRESKVRGTSFANGRLVAMLAHGAGFELETWRERKFTNRFGVAIFEDILTLVPSKLPVLGAEFGREVGKWALEDARKFALPEVADDLERAIRCSQDIVSSPINNPIFRVN